MGHMVHYLPQCLHFRQRRSAWKFGHTIQLPADCFGLRVGLGDDAHEGSELVPQRVVALKHETIEHGSRRFCKMFVVVIDLSHR